MGDRSLCVWQVEEENFGKSSFTALLYLVGLGFRSFGIARRHLPGFEILHKRRERLIWDSVVEFHQLVDLTAIDAFPGIMPITEL